MPHVRVAIAAAEWADEELRRVQEFYRLHPDPGLAVRDPESLMRAISDHKAFMIFDTATGDLVGVTLCFSRNDGEHTEVGGTRIILNGYHLQRLITSVCAVHEFLRAPPEKEFYAVVANWNTVSSGNLQAIGFVPWVPDKNFVEQPPAGGISQPFTFYRLPRSALTSMADTLISFKSHPEITSTHAADTLRVDLDVGFIRDDVLTPSMDFGT
jgi:hypothetical protein